MSGPKPLSGSTNDLKKSIGQLVFRANSDVLALQKGYKKVKEGGSLNKIEMEKETSLKETVAGLTEGIKDLELKPDYVAKENLQKHLVLMKTTVQTANIVLGKKEEAASDVNEESIGIIIEEAKTCLHEIEIIEELLEKDIMNMSKIFSTLAGPVVTMEEEPKQSEAELQFERDLDNVDNMERERFWKISKEISTKMREQIAKLDKTWSEEKDIIDYQGMKDIRWEFDQIDKKLRFIVNEWDKRQHGAILTDSLVDAADKLYEEYSRKYNAMADVKRKESIVRRKRDQEILEYRNEKKRAIPSWPEKIPYSKFKPDLLSWDTEHYLTSASSKFGQLIEMLKKEGRLSTFEQISTRLGRNRDDKDIIPKVVALLDAINEETCFNKLSKAWDTITSLKRKSSESLNEFFSRFETNQYSLNLADDSYIDLPKGAAPDEKELMASRRIELNDKLKAVILIKSLNVDESHKRDILAKVCFKKEPSEVYEACKTAIKDICGDSEREKQSDNVLLTKPWQNRSRSWSRNEGRRDRSYSRSQDRYQGRSRE